MCYLCIYVNIYAYTYLDLFAPCVPLVCRCLQMHINMNTPPYTHMHICMFIHLTILTHMHPLVYPFCGVICIYTFVYTFVKFIMYAYTCMHICISTYCIKCMYVYTFIFWVASLYTQWTHNMWVTCVCESTCEYIVIFTSADLQRCTYLHIYTYRYVYSTMYREMYTYTYLRVHTHTTVCAHPSGSSCWSVCLCVHT